MKISVVVPVYNAADELPGLLRALDGQRWRDFEVLLVDDASSDDSVRVAAAYGYRVLPARRNRGPAACRNRGAAAAAGEILAFTDSDCRPAPGWLEAVAGRFEAGGAEVLMGRLALDPSDRLGDAISALGFPAGGSIGFEKIWRVDGNGYTDSLSSCNCALGRELFRAVGGFDESFPLAGGEDTFLAYRLRRTGARIRFCPEMVVHHAARNDLRDFLRWQYRRGISSYIFSRKVTGRRSYLALRLWSTRNILRTWRTDPKFPLILFLFCAGYAAQLTGFGVARTRKVAA